MFLRKIYGIYLRYFYKIQGGHDIFDLHGHIVITRNEIIGITIPKAIIKRIKEMAARDKVTSQRFKNRAGVIYDNDWIPGV